MSLFLDPVQVLLGPEESVSEDCVLIIGRNIEALGEKARQKATELGIKATNSRNKLLAPCLVDPHSSLYDPFNNPCQTIESLKQEAAISGYGQIAILPKSSSWRDRPERLLALDNKDKKNVVIHLWGSFSMEGEGKELSPHKDLINFGAIGLAEDDSIPPTDLLKKGFTLGEMGDAPILLAPRDKKIQANGIARESIEALRAGWPQDPFASEEVALSILISLQNQHPEINMRLMNLSTSNGVEMLCKSAKKILSSVSWWHIVSDNSTLSSTDIGLCVTPTIGSKKDKDKLIQGLEEGVITGISVNSIPLDQSETIKPINDRLPGLSGHSLVLPSLWDTLVVQRKWGVEQLWEAISFGPSKLLNQPPERLIAGSNRWLLFNPNKKWTQRLSNKKLLASSNQPFEREKLQGLIEDCGLIEK